MMMVSLPTLSDALDYSFTKNPSILHTVVDITLFPTGSVVPEDVGVIEFSLTITNPESIVQLPLQIFVDIQTIARTAGTPKTI